jgi:orotate phosphoribosyltransferase|tara:strand:- start:606 stop:1121 length:516 start_codon:yes stop_codon:yes gene_type:complete
MNLDLLELLKKHYRYGDIILSSGATSMHYINCKPVALSNEGIKLIAPAMLKHVDPDSDAVAGVTLGGDPLATGVSITSPKLDALIVRKEPKGYGTQAMIEGPLLPTGTVVTLLEDVVTTGGSAVKAVKVLREAGYVVNKVVCIVDRRENGEDPFTEANLELVSLFKLEDFS